MELYKSKYLKYKNKYLLLQNQSGGNYVEVLTTTFPSFKKSMIIDINEILQQQSGCIEQI